MRPMFGASVPHNSIAFVSKAAEAKGVRTKCGLKKRVEAVKNCRNIGKSDMKFNAVKPKMKVDAESYTVEADGMVCEAEPSTQLPLAQTYYLY
ncbi:hypothetical protein KCU73_g11359, partial [Aureobasidium melanogenum]